MDEHINHNNNKANDSHVGSVSSQTQKDLDSAITQKNPKIGPVIREPPMHVQKTDEGQTNEFIQRLSFDRSEFIRRYAQTDKTDNELIKETLEHFQMREGTDHKSSAQADRHSYMQNRSKDKVSKEKYSSKDSFNRMSASKREPIMRRDFSVEELLKSIDGKRGKHRVVGKANTVESMVHIREMIQSNVGSFNDLPVHNHNHSRELFVEEMRASKKVKPTNTYKSFRGMVKEFKASTHNYDIKKRKPFQPKVDSQLADHYTTNSSVEMGGDSESRANDDEKCIRMSVYDSREQNTYNFLNTELRDNFSSIKRVEVREGKISAGRCSKFREPRDNDCSNEILKILSKPIERLQTEPQLAEKGLSFEDDGSYNEDNCDSQSTCRCHKLKLLAQRVGMALDDKFMSFMTKAVLEKAKVSSSDQNENHNKHNTAFSRYMGRQNTNIERKDLLSDKHAGGLAKNEKMDRKLRKRADILGNANSDRLRAFKKMFVKTEVGPAEGRKAVTRRQSKELESLR